jgi:hypothetical protein
MQAISANVILTFATNARIIRLKIPGGMPNAATVA